MRPVFDELTERLPEQRLAPGPLGPLAKNASSAVLSAQLGAMTGYLAQRVLGQYDIPLLDPGGTPQKLMFNRTIGLRDTWSKEMQKG